MKKFLENSVAYGLLIGEGKIISESIEAGVDVQKVIMKSEEIHKGYSDKAEVFSALWYSWVNQKKLFPIMCQGLNRHIDEDCFDFLAELLKTEEGLAFLKNQVDLGLDLTKVKDKAGNNLLHLYFRPLNSHRWGDSITTMPISCLEFLLTQNVDPNAVNHLGKAPLHQVISFRGDKESGKKVGLMVKHKADLCLEDAEGVSVITRLLEIGLQSAEVIRFLKKVTISSGKRELSAILNRSGNSDKLVQAYVEKGALNEYKMLEYIYPNYKQCTYSNLSSVIEFDNQVEELLKEERLKDFLHKLMGTSSSRMTNCFLEYHKPKKDMSFNYRFVHSAIVLKQLFMNENELNPDYLYQSLSNPKIVYGIEYMIKQVSIDQTVGFLKYFSQKQVLSLLESMNEIITDSDLKSSSRWTYCSHGYNMYDSIRLFWKYPDEIKELLATQKFSSINTFKKLHDFISKEATKIQQKPYDLEQDKVHPEITECENKELEELTSYQLIVPKTNHELIVWGTTLGNCVGGGTYAERAKMGTSIILGIESDNQLKYCLEIIEGRITQIEGKQRMKPPVPVMNSLLKTLVKAKLISKEK